MQYRLSPLDIADLGPDQHELYTDWVGSGRNAGLVPLLDESGNLRGPFVPLLYAPRIGRAVSDLGSRLRFGGDLGYRLREVVVCAVAAHTGARFEWYAHSRMAVEAGLTEEQVAALGAGVEPEGLDTEERTALALAKELLASDRATRATFDHAVSVLGTARAIEVTVCVGYYRLISGVLGFADVPTPEDRIDAAER